MGETEWSDWCQWKARCALGLCDRPTQGRLATFAMQRLRRYARRASGLTNLIDGADRRLPHDAAQAWHLFETHALAVLTREGKAYKEWLFARTQNTGDAPCDVVEAGASLMLRDVARRFLMNECLRPGTRSLDAPVTGSVDETLTYRDLLPDAMTPADTLAARELDMMAAQEACKRVSFRLYLLFDDIDQDTFFDLETDYPRTVSAIKMSVHASGIRDSDKIMALLDAGPRMESGTTIQPGLCVRSCAWSKVVLHQPA